MTEYFVVANSNPAPIVGDKSTHFVQGSDARSALEKFAKHYSHPCGLYSAKIYASSDAYHKNHRHLAEWRTHVAIAQEDPGGGRVL
jgi:hypothetical protein